MIALKASETEDAGMSAQAVRCTKLQPRPQFLSQDSYIDRASFQLGDFATSSVLRGFSVAVSTLFEKGTVSQTS